MFELLLCHLIKMRSYGANKVYGNFVLARHPVPIAIGSRRAAYKNLNEATNHNPNTN